MTREHVEESFEKDTWMAGFKYIQLPQPVLCAARCVCWRAILLKDESGGQLAIALKER